jgi:hypothetical protein
MTATVQRELARISRRERFVIDMERRAVRSSIEPITAEHVEYLRTRVRVFDEEAVREHWGSSPADMLAKAVRDSLKAWTGLVDGRPICAFGLCAESITSDAAVAWLIPTPDIQVNRRLFWRGSREVVEIMLGHYPHLIAHCQANYAASRRWLERLGFIEVASASFHVATGSRDPKAFRPGIGFITLRLDRS